MTEQSDELDRRIRRNLKILISGLTQDDVKAAYEGHRELFRVGASALPQLRDAVLKSNWKNVRRANEISYVSGLVNLIHDIDEAEAKDVTDRLKRGGCAPAVRSILDSICRFTLADYAPYVVCEVKIFEHRNLDAKQSVRATLEQWLRNVPGEDLKGIERIYVLRKEDLESLGSYRPILHSINLVWDNPSWRLNPMYWIDLLITEHTLYHEIGHYVHRHTFGQDPKQEREAEQYADRLLERSPHPQMRFVRALGSVIRFVSHRERRLR